MKGRVPLAILIVAVTLVCCLAGPIPRLVFLLLCAMAASYETYAILSPGGERWHVVPLFGFLLVCGGLSLLRQPLIWYMVAFCAAVHLILVCGALTYRPGGGKSALMALTALVYPGSLFGMLLAVSQLERWLWVFAVGVLTAWICDSAALLVGKKWGRHLLKTHVSPHKTAEGCAAGAIASLPTGLLCWALFQGTCPLSPWAWMLICLIASSWGQLGDLAASLVKRAVNQKDFSTLLGPHGGIMDKFDSMVFSIPMAYLCLYIAGVI